MGLRQELADVRPHWITRESAARHRSESAAMVRRTTRRFRKRDRTLKKEGCAARRAIPLTYGK